MSTHRRDAVLDKASTFLTPRKLLASTLEVRHLDVTVCGLPQVLDGFTIAHISDLHVGWAPGWHPAWVAEAAEAVHRARPEVVVNTGDFMWRAPSVNKILHFASPFRVDAAGGDTRGRNLAILGNHDYYAPSATVRDLKQGLNGIGISVLINSGTCVSRGDRGVAFVGATDEEPGFDLAMAWLQSAPHPRVALIHRPDLVEKVPPGAADVVLSGHTHGAQVAVPGLKSRIVKRFCGSNYIDGLYRVNDMPVYINRGLGYTGVPVRIGARPEVTILRLVR